MPASAPRAAEDLYIIVIAIAERSTIVYCKVSPGLASQSDGERIACLRACGVQQLHARCMRDIVIEMDYSTASSASKRYYVRQIRHI